MLTVDEFSAGDLSTAKPISLLRPTASHDREVLVAGSDDKPIAIILHDEYAYQWFQAAGSSDWTGLIIPNLRIELDETSAFDARYERPPLGAAMRKGSELAICTKQQNGMGMAHISLIGGLHSLGDHKVGFTRWQLVLGEDTMKRIIRKFDLTPIARS